jgi:hypothetical protein
MPERGIEDIGEGRCRRIKRRMSRCREIGIDRVLEGRGQWITMRFYVEGTPRMVRSANTVGTSLR